MARFKHIGIIGGGAWGTALAIALLRANLKVTLWAFEADVVTSINKKNENSTFLPGVTLDPQLKATANLADLTACDALILATPAQHLRRVAKQLAKTVNNQAPILIAAKGIELETSALLSDVVAQELPQHPLAIISGPSFAKEVAQGLPAALTLAMKDKKLGEELMQALTTPAFRLYLTDDIVGAQVGGAVKNVLAIACGIVAGRAMGENGRAAIITRGLAEIMRLGAALGARPETLMGLSGLGDLVLTCSGAQSRNTSLGMALGQGKALADILAERSSVAEGVTTASAAVALAKKHKVDMPIVMAVDAVLSRKADIDNVIASLLARPVKAE